MLAIDHIEAPVLRDLKLPVNASIVVAGAYKGDTVAFLREHHKQSHILACEPQGWAFEKLVERFGEAGHGVTCIPVALGAVDQGEACTLYNFGTDGCTLLSDGTMQVADAGVLAPAVATLKQLGFGFVDLFHMNMEGYEYWLIPWLLKSPDVFVRRWLIQFHHIPSMGLQYEDTCFKLQVKGYKLQDIGKGWELWER